MKNKYTTDSLKKIKVVELHKKAKDLLQVESLFGN